MYLFISNYQMYIGCKIHRTGAQISADIPFPAGKHEWPVKSSVFQGSPAIIRVCRPGNWHCPKQIAPGSRSHCRQSFSYPPEEETSLGTLSCPLFSPTSHVTCTHLMRTHRHSPIALSRYASPGIHPITRVFGEMRTQKPSSAANLVYASQTYRKRPNVHVPLENASSASVKRKAHTSRSHAHQLALLCFSCLV